MVVPTSPVLLTTTGPLGHSNHLKYDSFQISKRDNFLARLEFENRLKQVIAPEPLIIIFTARGWLRMPAILREISKGTSY